MASTNTNTSKETSVLSTDIYEISDFIENIRQNTIPDISDTLQKCRHHNYKGTLVPKNLV